MFHLAEAHTVGSGLSIEELDEASNDLIDELLREARRQQLDAHRAHISGTAARSLAHGTDASSSTARDELVLDDEFDDSVGESEQSTGKLSIDAFELLVHLADGAYSTVEIGRRKASQRLFAVKCIDKGTLPERNARYPIVIAGSAARSLTPRSGRLVRFDKTAAVLREKLLLAELCERSLTAVVC
jgi:hypothetical protein